MLKISKMTDYATVLLAELASVDQGCSASMLSARTLLPIPTVSKLLKQLQKSNLIHSTRGVSGGYRLARSAEHIAMTDILVAMEGSLALTECEAHGACTRQGFCTMRRHWVRINQAVKSALDAVSLAELAQPARTGIRSIRPDMRANQPLQGGNR